MPAIILSRVPKYRCRACPAVYMDGEERGWVSHVRACAEEYAYNHAKDRSRLDFLKSQDPEYSDWAREAFRKGLLKPSTERVS